MLLWLWFSDKCAGRVSTCSVLLLVLNAKEKTTMTRSILIEAPHVVGRLGPILGGHAAGLIGR